MGRRGMGREGAIVRDQRVDLYFSYVAINCSNLIHC